MKLNCKPLRKTRYKIKTHFFLWPVTPCALTCQQTTDHARSRGNTACTDAGHIYWQDAQRWAAIGPSRWVFPHSAKSRQPPAQVGEGTVASAQKSSSAIPSGRAVRRRGAGMPYMLISTQIRLVCMPQTRSCWTLVDAASRLLLIS